MGNCEVTPQAICPMARAMLNRNAAKVTTAFHGYSDLKFLPYNKANAIAECLENRFTHHYMCDESHERRVENIVQDIIETENTATWKKKPCDLKKLIKSLKFKKACGIDGIQNGCLRHLQRRPLVHLTHLFNNCFRLSYFPISWKENKIITLPKQGKDPEFPQNLRQISLLPTKRKLFDKLIPAIAFNQTPVIQPKA
jgi:uncharacterized protein YlaI